MEKRIGVTKFQYNPDDPMFPFQVEYLFMPNIQSFRSVKLMRHLIPQETIDLLDKAALDIIGIADGLDADTGVEA